jgi:predicted secreted protein
MSVSLTIALYLIVWWIVLFTLLPFKMGAPPERTGSDPFAEAAGAPSSPKLKTKFLLATVISALIVGALYAAFALELIALEPPTSGEPPK